MHIWEWFTSLLCCCIHFSYFETYKCVVTPSLLPLMVCLFLLSETLPTCLRHCLWLIKRADILSVSLDVVSWHDLFGTFSLTSFLFFSYFWTVSSSFLLFSLISGIMKASPKGIYWRWTTRKGHLLLMWSWHLPPVHNVATVSQLLHAIGVSPAHHDLKACVMT